MNALADLLRRPPAEQAGRGYADTAREIAQQPDTWLETARAAVNARPLLRASLAAADVRPGGAGLVVLTGSGSSLYAAECAAMPLQQALQTTVRAVPSGQMLTHLDGCVPPARSGLCLSLARSGDSPESTAVVDRVLAARPAWQHVIITCNGGGRLATRYTDRAGTVRLVLADRTCDRSLVMTSSFSNMLLATHILASLDDPRSYLEQIARIATAARYLLDHSSVLATTARGAFRSAMFLGSGSRLGAAREAALKMVEMTAGGVAATADTFLGVRHGPMSAVHADTLVICFLASDPITRAYELDLIRELNRKQLGTRLIIGDEVPADVVRDQDLVLDCRGLARAGDDMSTATDAMAGQLLAMFRCLATGLRPDAPSTDNVINRVVEDFALYHRHDLQPDAEP
ncbi:MAG: tagatose-6-phosphate ketose isomerase [Vicinamibacteraceae bacterium]